MSTGRELVHCRDLVIGYGKHALLPAFDVSVRTGEMLLVCGRNGAGKTTLLRTMLGLIRPLSGRVDFADPEPRMAYVPQFNRLDEVLPVRARDVASWGRLRGWDFLRPVAGRGDRQTVRNALVAAGADGFSHQAFRELSGGQRQRVMFARMMASEADLILLDEPTASLDLASERDAYEQLAAMAEVGDTAIVVVTHTIAVAAEFCNRALFLDRGARKGEGVVEVGDPQAVFDHPLFRRHFGGTRVGDG